MSIYRKLKNLALLESMRFMVSPEKRYAHKCVERAINRGDLIRPEVCESCGLGGRIEAHHEDYLVPLSVLWLCKSCHVKKHVKTPVFR